VVVKFVKTNGKNMISILAAKARQLKKNIAKHLPRYMQKQCKSLQFASSGKKIRYKSEGFVYCPYTDGEKILSD